MTYFSKNVKKLEHLYIAFGNIKWRPYFVGFFFFLRFRAALMAYENPQARDPIEAAAAGLYHSYNVGSEQHL